jgi:hypothetical protein
MAASTPKSSNSSTQNADFTRPQEPQSPTNLNRTTKRHQRALNINAPPRLDLGSDARTSNTATTAIGGRLDAIEREAKLQRTVMYDFASTVDKFVSSYKQPEQRSFAHDMCNKIVSFLTTSLDADTNGSTFVPIRVRSQPPGGTPSSSAAKSASFADMAKTLKRRLEGPLHQFPAESPLPPPLPTPLMGRNERIVDFSFRSSPLPYSKGQSPSLFDKSSALKSQVSLWRRFHSSRLLALDGLSPRPISPPETSSLPRKTRRSFCASYTGLLLSSPKSGITTPSPESPSPFTSLSAAQSRTLPG